MDRLLYLMKRSFCLQKRTVHTASYRRGSRDRAWWLSATIYNGIICVVLLSLFLPDNHARSKAEACAQGTVTIEIGQVYNASENKTNAQVNSDIAGAIESATDNALSDINVTISAPDAQEEDTIEEVDNDNFDDYVNQYGNAWSDDTINILIVKEITVQGAEGGGAFSACIFTQGQNQWEKKLVFLEENLGSDDQRGNVLLHELGHAVGCHHTDSASNLMDPPVDGDDWDISEDIAELEPDSEAYSPQSDHRNQEWHLRNYDEWNDQFDD